MPNDLLAELSTQIDQLSQNLSAQHQNISWKIDFNHFDSENKPSEMNVTFSDRDKKVLDLQFTFTNNNVIQVDGGLVHDQHDRTLIESVKSKVQFEILKNCLSSSKNLMFYSYYRIKSISPIQFEDFKKASKMINSLMSDIEIFFKYVLLQPNAKLI